MLGKEGSGRVSNAALRCFCSLFWVAHSESDPSGCVGRANEGVSETRGQAGAVCTRLPHRLCPQIYFWEDQRRNLTERVKTLFLAENGVKLKNLTGYTTYMVSVAAFNAAGDGPPSSPTRGQTQQAGGENGRSREGWSAGKGRRDHRPLALVGSGGSCLIAPAEVPGLGTQAPAGCLQSGRAQPTCVARKGEALERAPRSHPPTHTSRPRWPTRTLPASAPCCSHGTSS